MLLFIGENPIIVDNFTSSSLLQVGQAVPVMFVSYNETGDLRQVSSIPLVPALINLGCQGTLLFLLRMHILKRAEWYLGRINGRAGNVVRGNQSGDAAADMNEGSRLAVSPVVGAAS